jgi:hypothetical protein
MAEGEINAFYANAMLKTHLLKWTPPEGRQYKLLDKITNHWKDSSAIDLLLVTKDRCWILMTSQQSQSKKTTRGWKLLVKWKEGSTDWIDELRDLQKQQAFPIELAEYAKPNHLLKEEVAFAWWMSDALQTRKNRRILAKLKSRYWKTTHKLGIVELPHSVAQANKLDCKNGNDL